MSDLMYAKSCPRKTLEWTGRSKATAPLLKAFILPPKASVRGIEAARTLVPPSKGLDMVGYRSSVYAVTSAFLSS